MSELDIKIGIENKFGENLIYFLEDYSCGEEKYIDSAYHEVRGEDEQGRDTCCEINTLDLAREAAMVMNLLISERDALREELRKAREQEPTGYIDADNLADDGKAGGYCPISPHKDKYYNTPLYASPVPAQKIQGDKWLPIEKCDKNGMQIILIPLDEINKIALLAIFNEYIECWIDMTGRSVEAKYVTHFIKYESPQPQVNPS